MGDHLRTSLFPGIWDVSLRQVPQGPPDMEDHLGTLCLSPSTGSLSVADQDFLYWKVPNDSRGSRIWEALGDRLGPAGRGVTPEHAQVCHST